MKVIDIFNKIANREEVPERIKWRDKIWRYDTGMQDYIERNNVLFAYGINNHRTYDFLTDEVEIIEEKKIPEKLDYPHIEIESSADDEIRDYLYKVKDKFDEIIDYLQSKGEK